MRYPIDINTSEYEYAHGKKPRGQGSWAFCPRQNYMEPYYLDHCVWFTGLYSEARKQAVAHFSKQAGNPVIVVCS